MYRDGGILDYHLDLDFGPGEGLIIAPSPELISRLPGGRIPDRDDFYRLTDEERIRAWRQVLAESRRMGEELWDLLCTGRLAEKVRPLQLKISVISNL